MKYTCDDFFVDVWDTVSEFIVDDSFFFSFDNNSPYDPEHPGVNEQFIRALTFDIYRQFDKRDKLNWKDHDTKNKVISEAAKLMEMFFSNLLKYKPILEAPKQSPYER